MRMAVVLAAAMLASCASDQLAQAPPQGIDLSGHWKLNEADSDDPLRLMQTQLSNATANAGAGGQTGTSNRRSGGRGGAGLGAPAGPGGPVMPSVTILDEALRWPGRDLTLTQSAGVVTFAVDGRSRTCRLGGRGSHHRPPPPSGAPPGGRNRDMPARGRGDAAPPLCGWDEGTLVVKSGEPDDDRPPFELRFSLSEDHERLVEVVNFTGGRSGGFTASREWDRLPQ